MVRSNVVGGSPLFFFFFGDYFLSMYMLPVVVHIHA
jgi:hypothetical protein